MAKCPRCNKEIKWNGCQDAFIFPNGHYLKEETVLEEKETEIRKVSCDCGEIVGVWVVSPEQTTIFNHQEFSQIDWTDEANSFPW
jgi:uncharacterized protein YheU (UPF0270 family)